MKIRSAYCYFTTLSSFLLPSQGSSVHHRSDNEEMKKFPKKLAKFFTKLYQQTEFSIIEKPWSQVQSS